MVFVLYLNFGLLFDSIIVVIYILANNKFVIQLCIINALMLYLTPPVVLQELLPDPSPGKGGAMGMGLATHLVEKALLKEGQTD